MSRLRWTAYLLARAAREPADRRSSAAALARLRDRRARSIARFAVERVPWYAAAMVSRGISPADIRGAADLERFPVLEPHEIGDHPHDFLPGGAPRGDWIELQTSGTSGEPRLMWLDPAGAFTMIAAGLRERNVARRFLRRAGRVRSLVLAGQGYPHARTTAALEKLLLRPQRLLPERRMLPGRTSPEELAREMGRFAPHLLHGNGSAIGPFFRWAHETGARFPRPRLVTYTSDAITPDERRFIEEEFAVPVLSLYRCTEAVLLGFECGEGKGFHINDDLVHLRIADDEGRTVPDGETGSVMLSNLVNRGTVLLNYRLGDLAAAISEPCPCGRPLSRVELRVGRDYDWVRHPDGRKIHPYQVTAIMDEGGVSRWQLFQADMRRLVIRVVPIRGADPRALSDRLTMRYREALGPGMEPQVEFVDAIERSAAGKLLVLAKE